MIARQNVSFAAGVYAVWPAAVFYKAHADLLVEHDHETFEHDHET